MYGSSQVSRFRSGLVSKGGFRYISALVLSLSTMLHLEMPHLNVLSKMDLMHKKYSDLGRFKSIERVCDVNLDFRLDFYTEVQDLSVLLDTMTDEKAFSKKFRQFNEAFRIYLFLQSDEFCHLRSGRRFQSRRIHSSSHSSKSLLQQSMERLALQDKESVSHLVKLIDKSNGYVYTQNFDPYRLLQRVSQKSNP